MCLAALFKCDGVIFADSRMEVPRYRSSPSSWRSFFLSETTNRTRHNLQQSILICNAHSMTINKVAHCVVKTEINTNRTNINEAKIAQNKTRVSSKLTFVMRCWLQKG